MVVSEVVEYVIKLVVDVKYTYVVVVVADVDVEVVFVTMMLELEVSIETWIDKVSEVVIMYVEFQMKLNGWVRVFEIVEIDVRLVVVEYTLRVREVVPVTVVVVDETTYWFTWLENTAGPAPYVKLKAIVTRSAL